MEDVQFNFEDDNMFEFGAHSNSEDELNIKKSSKKKLKIKKASKPKSKPAPPKPKPQPTQQYTPQPAFSDKTFEAFSNPQKRMPIPEAPPSESSFGGGNDDDDVGNMSEQQSEMSEPAGYGNDEPEFGEPEPSNGFSSIDEEKQDLLFKFHRLEKKGVRLPKKFNMFSDIREMRMEFWKIKKDSEMNSSVKFSRRMLMAFVSASEFLNKRYDPFAVDLNGWSETVMENVNDGDYDNIFEKLHDKYAGKVNTPPELELLLSLGGSAVMFHMTSTMFKSVPNIGDIAKKDPNIQKAMKSMADSLMKAQMSPGPQQQNEESDNESIPEAGGRREMKGPSMDLSTFGNILPPPMPSRAIPQEPPPRYNPPPPAPQQIREIESDRESIFSSEQSGVSVKKVSVAVSEGGTRRGRKPKITATKENTIEI